MMKDISFFYLCFLDKWRYWYMFNTSFHCMELVSIFSTIAMLRVHKFCSVVCSGMNGGMWYWHFSIIFRTFRLPQWERDYKPLSSSRKGVCNAQSQEVLLVMLFLTCNTYSNSSCLFITIASSNKKWTIIEEEGLEKKEPIDSTKLCLPSVVIFLTITINIMNGWSRIFFN